MSRKELSDTIKKDLYRYIPQPYSIKNLLKGLWIPGFRYTYLLRKISASGFKPQRLYYKLLLKLFAGKYSFQIPPETDIGPGLYIGHFGTLIISMHAKLGSNCNLSPGVTIGRDHRGKRRGAPTLGNEVWVGTNAVIVGKVSIGNDVLIAPNSFVNFDVSDHSIVIGNPAKVISRENATEGYINNILNILY